MRPSGSSTGLAITPYQQGDKQGNSLSNEETQAWGVTHLNTGMLIDGPFSSLPKARVSQPAITAALDGLVSP
ncbi:MAG: hypothetical protein U0401_32285 [Anaerolineae bacterium]